MRRLITRLGALVAGAALAASFGTVAPASAASAYDICAWTGVRDGILGFGDASKLVHYHFFTWYGDTAVHCKAAIYLNGSSFARCHGWIVDPDTGYAAHLGECQFGAD